MEETKEQAPVVAEEAAPAEVAEVEATETAEAAEAEEGAEAVAAPVEPAVPVEYAATKTLSGVKQLVSNIGTAVKAAAELKASKAAADKQKKSDRMNRFGTTAAPTQTTEEIEAARTVEEAARKKRMERFGVTAEQLAPAGKRARTEKGAKAAPVVTLTPEVRFVNVFLLALTHVPHARRAAPPHTQHPHSPQEQAAKDARIARFNTAA